jgi:hypothetical protein
VTTRGTLVSGVDGTRSRRLPNRRPCVAESQGGLQGWARHLWK